MKRALFVILIVIGGLPFACTDQYGSYSSTPYKIDRIGIRVGEVIMESWYSSVDPAGANDTILAGSFGIELFVLETRNVVAAAADQPMFFSGLMNTAKADPVPPQSDSKIASIALFASDTVFTTDQKYAPGVSLNTLFEVTKSYYGEATTIDLLIANSDSWNGEETIIFEFTEDVTSVLTASFTVKVLMEDGDLFEVESDVVRIKPAD